MSAKYLLDTNILVYAFDTQTPQKQAIARQYLKHVFSPQKQYILSLQVVNEFCNVAQKKLKPAMSPEDLQTFIDLIPEGNIAPLSKRATLKALHIQKAHILSFWDSMIVATAISEGCHSLVTEDLSDGQTIESVTIVNPFTSAL